MNKGYSQPRNEKADQIDLNDSLFIAERTKRPVLGSMPAPVSIYTEGPNVGKQKINPHVSRFYLGTRTVLKKGWRPTKEYVYTDVFHVKPIYYLNINGGWRPMSEIASYYGNKRMDLKEDWALSMDLRYLSWLIKRMDLIGGKILIPSPFHQGQKIQLTDQIGVRSKAVIHFTTTTFYPNASPETTSVDGWVGRGDLGAGREDWATIRAGTGLASGDSDVTGDAIFINNYGGENAFKENRRGITLFDTSALTSGATISGAVLSVKPSAISDHHGATQALGVVVAVPASNTALTATDYNIANWTMTRQATDIDLGSLSAGTYADYTLNGTGVGNISKTGVTKYGWACSGDIDNSSPGNDPAYITSVTFNFADQTSTTSDPKLVVTYSTNVTYNQTISATSTTTAAIATAKTILQSMGATVTGSAAIATVKNFVRTLEATATATASVLKGVAKTIGATVSVTSSMTAERVFLVAMNAITTVSSEMTKVANYARTLGATATATASITKQLALNIALTATSTIEATLAAGRTVIMNATTTVTATLASAIGKTLDATVSIVAKISAPFWRTKYPANGDEDDYNIKYPHE